jgi:enoyl-CoA hydratase/carnithine racemase
VTSFDAYKDKYSSIQMDRRDGILQLTFHTDGGPLRWGGIPHGEFGPAFTDLGHDHENRVVIMTGTGTEFSGPAGSPSTFPAADAEGWDQVLRQGMLLTTSLLEINAVVISCVNGPAIRHPEIPLLADVVLAAPEASFQDSAHFANRMTPGDGVNFVLPLLLGFNRARYLMLTGQDITADRALDLGLVSEIHPRTDLLSRAWELAEQFAGQNPLVLRYTRMLLTQELRKRAVELLGFGLALEGLAVIHETALRANAGSE